MKRFAAGVATVVAALGCFAAAPGVGAALDRPVLPGLVSPTEVGGASSRHVRLPAKLVVLLRRLERLHPNTLRLEEHVVESTKFVSVRLRQRRSISIASTRSPALALVKASRTGKTVSKTGKQEFELRLVDGRVYQRDSDTDRLDASRPWFGFSPDETASNGELLKRLDALPRTILSALPRSIRRATSVEEVGAKTVRGRPTIEFLVRSVHRRVVYQDSETVGRIGRHRAAAPAKMKRVYSLERSTARIFFASDGLPVEAEGMSSDPRDFGKRERALLTISASEAPIAVSAPPASATMTEAERKELEKKEREEGPNIAVIRG